MTIPRMYQQNIFTLNTWIYMFKQRVDNVDPDGTALSINLGYYSVLTLILLNPDMPHLCKQCRSDQLAKEAN